MKHLLWAIVIILLGLMFFARDLEQAYDTHQLHSYELKHLSGGTDL